MRFLLVNLIADFTQMQLLSVKKKQKKPVHVYFCDVRPKCFIMCVHGVIVNSQSHHGHGQGKAVLSCLVHVGGVNSWRQVNTVSDRNFQNCFVQFRNAARTATI